MLDESLTTEHKQFILKTEQGYVTWINWTANVIPNLKFSRDIQDACVYKGSFLLGKILSPVEKTRYQVIKEKYEDLDVLRVNIEVI